MLQEAPLPPASFDAVTFFEVVEHLHDPLGDLRHAHSLLKPGGAVFVKVPNLDALQARLFGPWWYALQVPRHLYHFTRASLSRLLGKASFGPVRCRAIPDWKLGALMFEISLLYWLRGRHLARKGVEVAPTPEQTTGEALGGQVYAGVSPAAKRAFRWVAKNILYAPIGFENLIGRSVELLAMGRR